MTRFSYTYSDRIEFGEYLYLSSKLDPCWGHAVQHFITKEILGAAISSYEVVKQHAHNTEAILKFDGRWYVSAFLENVPSIIWKMF